MYNVSIKNNIESADIVRTSHRKPRASPAERTQTRNASRPDVFFHHGKAIGAAHQEPQHHASRTSRLYDAHSLLNRLDG